MIGDRSANSIDSIADCSAMIDVISVFHDYVDDIDPCVNVIQDREISNLAQINGKKIKNYDCFFWQ